MEGERHDTKRQGEADGERSAEKAMVEGRDGRTKEGRGGRAARTDREQTAPAGHFETFAKNASYMGGLREIQFSESDSSGCEEEVETWKRYGRRKGQKKARVDRAAMISDSGFRLTICCELRLGRLAAPPEPSEGL